MLILNPFLISPDAPFGPGPHNFLFGSLLPCLCSGQIWGTGCILSGLHFCHINNHTVLQSASSWVALSTDGFFVVRMQIEQAKMLAPGMKIQIFFCFLANYPGPFKSFYTDLIRTCLLRRTSLPRRNNNSVGEKPSLICSTGQWWEESFLSHLTSSLNNNFLQVDAIACLSLAILFLGKHLCNQHRNEMVIIEAISKVCAYLLAIVLSTLCVISDLIHKITVILQKRKQAQRR